jgi:hypothetical protein
VFIHMTLYEDGTQLRIEPAANISVAACRLSLRTRAGSWSTVSTCRSTTQNSASARCWSRSTHWRTAPRWFPSDRCPVGLTPPEIRVIAPFPSPVPGPPLREIPDGRRGGGRRVHA